MIEFVSPEDAVVVEGPDEIHVVTAAAGGEPVDLSGVAKLGEANTFTTGLQVIDTGASTTAGLIINGHLTDGSYLADLLRLRDKDGRFSRVNRRGALVLMNGADTIDSLDVDLFCPGYAFLGGIRLNGADGSANNILQTDSSRDLGLVIKDNQARLIHLRTEVRRLYTAGFISGDDNGRSFVSYGHTSPFSGDRAEAGWQTVWADNTDSTRAGRLTLVAYSVTTAQEGLRVEGNGGGVRLGFFGASAVAKPEVTGSAGGNAALESLLTALANLGLITDSTT